VGGFPLLAEPPRGSAIDVRTVAEPTDTLKATLYSRIIEQREEIDQLRIERDFAEEQFDHFFDGFTEERAARADAEARVNDLKINLAEAHDRIKQLSGKSVYEITQLEQALQDAEQRLDECSRTKNSIIDQYSTENYQLRVRLGKIGAERDMLQTRVNDHLNTVADLNKRVAGLFTAIEARDLFIVEEAETYKMMRDENSRLKQQLAERGGALLAPASPPSSPIVSRKRSVEESSGELVIECSFSDAADNGDTPIKRRQPPTELCSVCLQSGQLNELVCWNARQLLFKHVRCAGDIEEVNYWSD
jgi:predicted nuclease with TOPRIM domain